MTTVTLGNLTFEPALRQPALLPPSVVQTLADLPELAAASWVAPIDPEHADTAVFCEKYNISRAASVNCVIVRATRGEKVTVAACLVPSTGRADVNGVIRRHLNARRASFAPQEQVVQETGMENGGITPLGLPSAWPILADPVVAQLEWAILGSGVRHSKLIVAGEAMVKLPRLEFLEKLTQVRKEPA